MYKVRNDLSPVFMKDIFKEVKQASGSETKFHRPNVRTVKRGERSLRNFGPIVWNEMLPDDLKKSVSLDAFKNSIKSWKPKGCPCELCKSWVPGVGYATICSCCN